MSLRCLAVSKCGQLSLWEDVEFQAYWLCSGEISKPVPPRSPFCRLASRLSEQIELTIECHPLDDECHVWLLLFEEHLLVGILLGSDSTEAVAAVFDRWPALLCLAIGYSEMLLAREVATANPLQKLLLERLNQNASEN